MFWRKKKTSSAVDEQAKDFDDYPSLIHDPVLQTMAREIAKVSDVSPMVDRNGTPRPGFPHSAIRDYERRGGAKGANPDAVARALLRLVEDIRPSGLLRDDDTDRAN